MKRQSLTSLLLLTLVFVGNAGNKVLINGNNAESDAAKLEFDGNKAIVTYSDGATINYDMEEVEIMFSQTSSSLNGANFLVLNNVVTDELQISGLNGGEKLQVCNSLGETLVVSKAESDQAVLDLKPLAKGVYFLKIDNQSIKFIKK